jgi:phage-related holin
MEETTMKLVFNLFLTSGAVFMYSIGIDINAMYYLSILLVIDYMTGLMKASRVGESITSHKMKYGVVSKLSIVIIPISFAITARALGLEFGAFLKIAFNLIILSELYSIVGNIYSIRTKEQLPEMEVISIIASKIRDFLTRGGKG